MPGGPNAPGLTRVGEELEECHTVWAKRILPFGVASRVQSWEESTAESGEGDGPSHLTAATKTQ